MDLQYAADFTLVPYSKLDIIALRWRTYIRGHRWAMYHLWQQEQGTDTNVDYSELLMTTADLNATRPEDQIYGMYGCAKRLRLDWPAPDYKKSVAQIYTEATVASFRKDKDLKIMTMAIGPAVGKSGFPSWVPDFSGSTSTPSLLKPPELATGFATDKQCSGASQCMWNFILDGRHLEVKGRRFDYVAAVSEPWRAVPPLTNTENMSTIEVAYQNVERFISCIDSSFEVALQRNKNRDSSTNLADELVAILDLAGLFESAYSDFQSLDRVAENISLITHTRKSDGDLITYQIDREDDNFEAIDEFSSTMHLFQWTLVFHTANKFCMGISNYNVKVGDLLVVFHGMKVPCLIRPCAGGFNFIGHAFVEGVLNGEFWEGGSDEDNEWFTLI